MTNYKIQLEILLTYLKQILPNWNTLTKMSIIESESIKNATSYTNTLFSAENHAFEVSLHFGLIINIS